MAVTVFAVIVIVLKLVPIVSPVSVKPVPEPIKRAFTVSELIVAVSEFIFAVLIFVVDSEEVKKARDISVENPVDKYPAEPRPITVEPSWVAKYDVLIKLTRFALETKLAKLAVETKLAKLAVETKLAKLAVETRLAKFAVLTTDPHCTVER
jgi:hypothetical protein